MVISYSENRSFASISNYVTVAVHAAHSKTITVLLNDHRRRPSKLITRYRIYILYLLWKSSTRHSKLKTHSYTSLYSIHIGPNATYLLTRNAADEHVNLISIKIKRICSITNKHDTEVALTIVHRWAHFDSVYAFVSQLTLIGWQKTFFGLLYCIFSSV